MKRLAFILLSTAALFAQLGQKTSNENMVRSRGQTWQSYCLPCHRRKVPRGTRPEAAALPGPYVVSRFFGVVKALGYSLRPCREQDWS